MSKSRVKSDQEYQDILGFSFDNVREGKDSNISGYFDELRENENITIDVNPFDKIVSIGDIKDSLKSDLDQTNVLDIKAEIALAQSNHNELYDEESKRAENKSNKGVTGENTRKLYDNLRYSHLNKVEPQSL
ncbi:MAG: hypothetical protein RR543_01360, partial [Erysipelotrichales bacterium]